MEQVGGGQREWTVGRAGEGQRRGGSGEGDDAEQEREGSENRGAQETGRRGGGEGGRNRAKVRMGRGWGGRRTIHRAPWPRRSSGQLVFSPLARV